MLTTTGAFEQELRKYLTEAIQTHVSNLETCAPDAIYVTRGKILGLRDALSMIDEAKSNTEKRING